MAGTATPITTAGLATATGMSSSADALRPRRALLALLALAPLASGCGSSSTSHPPVAPKTNSFAWLAMGSVPGSWPAPGTLAGGSLPRPPGWQPARGDRGTVSFVERRNGAIVGYLNATPRSGRETLANWKQFRVAHNADEGDRDVRLIDGMTGRTVSSSRVSCVKDSYRTSRSRYVELACLVATPRASTVVLGASPPGEWSRQQPVIERAIAGFVAS